MDGGIVMNGEPLWICPEHEMGDVVPEFLRSVRVGEDVEEATLTITGMGVYVAAINDVRVGEYILAPGFTTYKKRLQYQIYDVTELLNEGEDNEIRILLGKGWYRSRLVGWQPSPVQEAYRKNPAGLLAELEITYQNGSFERIVTDLSWTVRESRVRFSEIYDGEIFDASKEPGPVQGVKVFDGPDDTLIEQEGPEIREMERLSVRAVLTTPAGETVLDFGQEITGYVQIHVDAAKGDVIDLSFGEMLDADGNFYNANYRSAKAQYHYTCRDGEQTWNPLLTFYGFRYVRVNEFPGGPQKAFREAFTAIVVQSDMKRTGWIETSDPLVNRLVSNAVWSQKCNFLDVPTDCPQRDERLGWTGDAQVFAKTACYNFDTEQFYEKWLGDLMADQQESGAVGIVIPDLIGDNGSSAAWGDVATILPWEMYLAFGDAYILSRQFDSMRRWVDYITNATTTPYMWTGGTHFADWLGLDAPSGSYKGSTREDLIATAFYAHSAELVVKAGHVIGADVASYETLYEKIREAFQEAFPQYETQTECVLAAHFALAKDPQAAADRLAQMVQDAGVQLKTGFVGTPYLLHVLSSFGYEKLAWSLLLRKEYPSWLYPVQKGATTIWEHWDGIMEDGSFWSTDMNSFNHYAYGSVLDWIYGVAAGIRPIEEAPGYEKVSVAPHPDKRMGWLEARYDSACGMITSRWSYEESWVRYEITTPVDAWITIDGESRWVEPGSYLFYGKID